MRKRLGRAASVLLLAGAVTALSGCSVDSSAPDENTPDSSATSGTGSAEGTAAEGVAPSVGGIETGNARPTDGSDPVAAAPGQGDVPITTPVVPERGSILLAAVQEEQDRQCAADNKQEIQVGQQCFVLADGSIELTAVDKVEEEGADKTTVITLSPQDNGRYIDLINAHLNQPVAIILNQNLVASYTPTVAVPKDLTTKVPLGPLRDEVKKSVQAMTS